MHSLLKRQLKKYLKDYENPPQELAAFINAVDAVYQEGDDDRSMLERSLELSSQELLQANAEMRAVFRVFPDLFIWLDADGTVFSTQAGDPKDLFLPAAQLVGRRVQKIPDRSIAEKFQHALNSVNQGAGVTSFEYSIEIEKETSYFEARLLPLIDKKILAVIRNITERKRAVMALAAEKELLTVTLATIGDGVITTDAKGKIVLMNKVAQRLTGWSLAASLHQPLEQIFVIEGEHLLPQEGEISSSGHNWETVGTGGYTTSGITFNTTTQRDVLLIQRDRSHKEIVYSVHPILDQKSELTGTVVVFRDRTVERRQEEDRLRATKLESLGLLAGGIAHDFNNILAAILANVSLARMDFQELNQDCETLDVIETAVRRARDLTQQLLTFSRGGMPIKVTASVEELIRESAVFAMRGSNVRLEFSFPQDLMNVQIDKGQMSQVINNLIINANHAMPEGGVIQIGAENITIDDPWSEETLFVRIYVKDQGIGIPLNYRNKIFDPYFTTKQKGSGLGLATSFSIVKKHDGMITVESEPGVGSTFYIFLPAVAHAPDQKSPTVMTTVLGHQGRVLFMDDEEEILSIANRLLKRMGYHVDLARDGAEAIEMYERARSQERPYDVVIMDLTIPGGMGGKDTMAQLLKIDPKVKAIVSSGYSNDPVMAQFHNYGFCGVLTKPYDYQELSQVLSELMRS